MGSGVGPSGDWPFYILRSPRLFKKLLTSHTPLLEAVRFPLTPYNS